MVWYNNITTLLHLLLISVSLFTFFISIIKIIEKFKLDFMHYRLITQSPCKVSDRVIACKYICVTFLINMLLRKLNLLLFNLLLFFSVCTVQGSVLGPLLFILYTTLFCTVISKSPVHGDL